MKTTLKIKEDPNYDKKYSEDNLKYQHNLKYKDDLWNEDNLKY